MCTGLDPWQHHAGYSAACSGGYDLGWFAGVDLPSPENDMADCGGEAALAGRAANRR
jgi:hypothetical protein